MPQNLTIVGSVSIKRLLESSRFPRSRDRSQVTWAQSGSGA